MQTNGSNQITATQGGMGQQFCKNLTMVLNGQNFEKYCTGLRTPCSLPDLKIEVN